MARGSSDPSAPRVLHKRLTESGGPLPKRDGPLLHGWPSTGRAGRTPHVVNDEAGYILNFRPISLLAAFTAAAILPIAGPAQADAPIVPVMAVNAIAAAEVPATAEKTVEQPAPAFHAIAGGIATFYGRHLAGARTASGERYAPDALTAAHRTLPFGTQLQVTNPRTGASVVVTINDRGPFHSNRVLDLSDAAADQIGIRSAGSGAVQLAVLDN